MADNLPMHVAPSAVTLASEQGTHEPSAEEVVALAQAAAAALQLVAEAIRKGTGDGDAAVQTLKKARLGEEFADILDATAEAAWADHERNGDDLYEVRDYTDSLEGVAGDIRRIMERL
ncbi:hypothetical protein ACFC1B_07345 [Streptomyces xiamenensis]|uniref:hypothetical protein n=1 Tax=Streptomyces xiamenensis TaxID=408015 RepID=UPI0035E1C1D0